MSEGNSQDGAEPVGAFLAQRLVTAIEELNQNMVENRKLFTEIRECLKARLEVDGEVADDLDLFCRAMGILVENKRDGKVAFTDFAKSWQLALDELEEDGGGEDGDVGDREPILPTTGRR